MFYYLAQLLRPEFGFLNAFTYHTVRAGGAALTAFAISLLIGPAVIRALRALKIGQYIRKEHVADLHALHKGKAGTPTMGGALIILSTLVALLLWGRFSNRLLLIAMGATCLLGAVGFLDDYIKLRRKHNAGLSAKAKFAGQILSGLLIGVYLVYSPITYSATDIGSHDVRSWPDFVAALKQQTQNSPATPSARFTHLLPEGVVEFITDMPATETVDSDSRIRILDGFERVLARTDVYDARVWENTPLTPEAQSLLKSGYETLSPMESRRLNRLLLESAFPEIIEATPADIHTKVEVPGLRMVLIPFGLFYVAFVIVLLVSATNGVNLTDGLDGLATGASIVSLLAYTGIAYVVSRADWSSYLFLIHVPEASELTVFGAAMVGAGLGFLWFNSHPAEVFMGDTGSLALGGAIGTMAILTKQELLLIVVGGLFVVETASVLIQVASFKLRGKRVFRMAPLHHHFELAGWSESKVTIRFWIMALVFALMSLAALKLR
ncbi:MAG: phospho-N-acetylmuramoyl-pentapeptide-transferase [Candidatus Hydrogenedentes bacterium]|nr:phospho-N-acetylmuramoyl-pentapeptide-transferase [Candidatus Hydrogenedentota bacterium]